MRNNKIAREKVKYIHDFVKPLCNFNLGVQWAPLETLKMDTNNAFIL